MVCVQQACSSCCMQLVSFISPAWPCTVNICVFFSHLRGVQWAMQLQCSSEGPPILLLPPPQMMHAVCAALMV